jgi:hypothetical protein
MSTIAFLLATAVLYYVCFLSFVWIIRKYTHCSPNARSEASIREVLRLYQIRSLELEQMAEEKGVVLDS